MLVQFFLRELYNHPDLRREKPAGNMVVDGVCGPITLRWIDEYQKQLKRKGFSVVTDGRVDPARGELQFSKGSISGKRYTIWHMNGSYRRRFQSLHDHLERAPGVPAELAAALAINEATNAG